MLSAGQAAGLGVQVQDAMAELLVIAVHLVDNLLRAADQRGAPGGEVLDVGKDRLQAELALELALGVEDRPVAGIEWAVDEYVIAS